MPYVDVGGSVTPLQERVAARDARGGASRGIARRALEAQAQPTEHLGPSLRGGLLERPRTMDEPARPGAPFHRPLVPVDLARAADAVVEGALAGRAFHVEAVGRIRAEGEREQA